MEKQSLSILLVDRPNKQGEEVVKDIFMVYGPKYGLIVFPPKKGGELVIQVVFSRYSILRDLEEICHIMINYDPDDPEDFFDFDLYEIEEDTFYDMLSERFDVSTHKLTNIES